MNTGAAKDHVFGASLRLATSSDKFVAVVAHLVELRSQKSTSVIELEMESDNPGSPLDCDDFRKPMTPDFAVHVNKSIADTIPSEGSVAGRLERIDVHERNEFVLFPPIDGYSITCRFDHSLLEKVREALNRTVTVTGVLHFPLEGPFPRAVDVRTIVIHPSDSQLPTLSDLRGIGKGRTDGLTAVEFVRSLRDG